MTGWLNTVFANAFDTISSFPPWPSSPVIRKCRFEVESSTATVHLSYDSQPCSHGGFHFFHHVFTLFTSRSLRRGVSYSAVGPPAVCPALFFPSLGVFTLYPSKEESLNFTTWSLKAVGAFGFPLLALLRTCCTWSYICTTPVSLPLSLRDVRKVTIFTFSFQ